MAYTARKRPVVTEVNTVSTATPGSVVERKSYDASGAVSFQLDTTAPKIIVDFKMIYTGATFTPRFRFTNGGVSVTSGNYAVRTQNGGAPSYYTTYAQLGASNVNVTMGQITIAFEHDESSFTGIGISRTTGNASHNTIACHNETQYDGFEFYNFNALGESVFTVTEVFNA